MSRVLSGIRVLDFGRYVAGPYCATLLGYFGADVIRVERIGGGEDRKIAPVTENQADGAVFLQTSCNKRSICLNLGRDDPQGLLDRLISASDIVVANFPTQTLSRLGLDIESLRKIKPDIILANVTAFGESGPFSKRGGFDGVGQAMSGAMHITGKPGQPAKAATPYVDYTTAVLLAFGVMTALRERDQTGLGQEVSATLLGTALAMFNSHLVEQGVLELDRVGTGNRVQTSAPSDVFPTLDGYVLVHSPGDRIFQRCANLIGKSEWLDDPRFITDHSRGDHRDEICEALGKWCADKSTAAVLEILARKGIPAGPVLSPKETLAHPQTKAVGVLKDVSYPGLSSPAPVATSPVSLSLSEHGIDRRPPMVGEHTQEILLELGFSQVQIDKMKSDGFVA